MSMIRITLLVLGLLLTAAALAEDKPERRPAPWVKISKETTYVTGPLDKDGYIDYATALNERLGKGVTPQTNANVLIWQALGPWPEGGAPMPAQYFRWLGVESPPERGDYFLDLLEYMKERLKLDPLERREELFEQESRTVQRPWTAKEYPHIAGWLKANERPLALGVEASKRPYYFNPLLSPKTEKRSGGLMAAPLPTVQKCRFLARALTARAMLHLGEGRFDDAWQDLLACHRLGRLVARGILIEALLGMAIDQIASNADLAFLAHGTLTAKQIQTCLRDLQELPPIPAIADKVDVGERFMFLDAAQMVQRYGMQCFESLAGGAPSEDVDPRVEQAMKSINWVPALRNGNRWYDRLAAAMRLRDRAARARELEQIEQDVKKLKQEFNDWTKEQRLQLLPEKDRPRVLGEKAGDILICLLVPATGKVQHAADRIEQVHRNLHIAFALAAYHRNHGRYPMELDALAPAYLSQVPDDVFSGKALIYRPSEKGYLLYSVGVNGRDDGAQGPDDKPPGDDLSVRMPLPELRRR